MLQRIIKRSASTIPPLTESWGPLTKLNAANEAGYESVKDSIQSTTLSNGVKVITRSPRTQLSTIAVVIQGGSRFESGSSQGAAGNLKYVARLSTEKRTGFNVAMTLEDTPMFLRVCTGREAVSYVAQTPSTHVAGATELLADVTLHPKYADHEVHDQMHYYEHELTDHPCSQRQANDLLMEAAYGDSPIANTPRAAKHGLGISAATMKEFHSTTVSPKRIVVSATGVDHKEFVAEVQKNFGSLSSSSSKTASSTPSVYYGGDARLRTASEKVNIVLGFDAPSNSAAPADIAAMRVAVAALGGGSTSYTDHMGPGTGLKSLLYKDLVAAHSKVVYWCRAAYEAFSDAGLLRVHARVKAGGGPAVVETLTKTLKAAAAAPLSNAELARAKNAARFAYHSENETSIDQAQNMGKAPLGAYAALTDADFSAVTASDVMRVLGKALASAPTLSAVGAAYDVPRVKSL